MRSESAKASPPSTMLLIDDPPSCSTKNVAQMESGIEKNTATGDAGAKAAQEQQDHGAGEKQAEAALRAAARFDGGAHGNATDRTPLPSSSAAGTSTR